ncbi:MAG: hypothetical protein WEA99_09010 [Brumimicrobium sp.]
MRYPLLFATLIIIGFITSCSQKTKSDSESIAEDETPTKEQEEIIAETKMYEIENATDSFQEVRSLVWEKTMDDNSEFVEVKAYINDAGYPSKILESFSEGNFKEQGERHYYFENNDLIAVAKKADKWIDSNSFSYVETETFYENDKPKLSRTRSSDYIDNIDEEEWEVIRPKEHNDQLKRVEAILKGEGKFKTHFISVIRGQNELFLLLGEPKKDKRFVTTVKVEEMTPFIEDLITNMDEYKFKPINVQFRIVGGGGNPEFRVLTEANWEEE